MRTLQSVRGYERTIPGLRALPPLSPSHHIDLAYFGRRWVPPLLSRRLGVESARPASVPLLWTGVPTTERATKYHTRNILAAVRCFHPTQVFFEKLRQASAVALSQLLRRRAASLTVGASPLAQMPSGKGGRAYQVLDEEVRPPSANRLRLRQILADIRAGLVAAPLVVAFNAIIAGMIFVPGDELEDSMSNGVVLAFVTLSLIHI